MSLMASPDPANIHAVDHSIEDAMARLHDGIATVDKRVSQLTAQVELLACFACHIERANAERAGAEGRLPELRPVVAILPMTAVATQEGIMFSGGGGVCVTHLQIGEPTAPAMPGRTASGLIVAAPGMGV